jgi:hypothetical protein
MFFKPKNTEHINNPTQNGIKRIEETVGPEPQSTSLEIEKLKQINAESEKVAKEAIREIKGMEAGAAIKPMTTPLQLRRQKGNGIDPF